MIKKMTAILLAIVIGLTLCACGSTDNDSSEKADKDVTEAVVTEEKIEETKEEPTEATTEKEIEEATTEEEPEPDLTTDEGKTAWTEKYFDDTVKSFGKLDHVEINKDAGNEDGVIMLVYCSFDMPNKADTAKKTISMLAEDMAARVGQDLSDVNELCIFWDVPYLESDAKTQFERKDNGMAIGDQVFNF